MEDTPRAEGAEARQARVAASLRRSRWSLLVLGVGLALGLHALFERQARRLDALGEHGRVTRAIVTGVQGSDGGGTTDYEYTVDGTSHSWNVRRSEAPFDVGASFSIVYLPEDPELSRPGDDRRVGGREAANSRRVGRYAELGVLGFFLLNMLTVEIKARKQRQGRRVIISARAMGRAFALLLVGTALTADFADGSSAVFEKAFGVAPFGVPVLPLVATINVLLLLPYFWICEHVMIILYQAIEDRAIISRSGIVAYVWDASRLHPELARSRRLVLFGFGYFVLLCGAWIAYAALRGI